MEIVTNIYPIALKGQLRAYRYDLSLQSVSEFRKAKKESDILKGSKDDHSVFSRRRLAMNVVKFVFEKYPLLSKRAVYVYDMASTIYTNEPISQKIRNIAFEKSSLPPDIQAMLKFQKVLVSIEPCKELAHVIEITDAKGQLQAASVENDNSIRQFFELLINQKPLRSETHFSYGSGSLFLVNGATFGLPSEEMVGHRSIIHGVSKGVRFIKSEGNAGSIIPALVVDAQKGVFFDAVPLLRMIEGNLGESPIRLLSNAEFFGKFRDVLKHTIRNIRLQHESGPTFLAGGFTDKAVKYLTFIYKQPARGRGRKERKSFSTSMVEYYSRQGISIRDDFPCVYAYGDMGTFFPLEVLNILPFQRVGKAQQPLAEREEISKRCDLLPDMRFKSISRHIDALDLHKDQLRNAYMTAFRTTVERSPIKVIGHARRAPTLCYKGKTDSPGLVAVNTAFANWRQSDKEFLVAANIPCWIILYDNKEDFATVREFASKVFDECLRRGVDVNKPRVEHVPFESLESFIVKYRKNQGNGSLFVVYVDNRQKSHDTLKLLERLHEVITQHILTSTLTDRQGYESTILENIVNKINCKNFGQCYGVVPEQNIVHEWISNQRTLVFGYDVCHPDPETKSKVDFDNWCCIPSVVGMSYNAAACCETFIGDYAYQDGRVEKANGEILESRLFAVLEMFESNRGGLPDTLIIVRDGVSEGQFEMVKSEEVESIKIAIANYRESRKLNEFRPKILCVVACKRHHKRFFTEEGDKMQNCAPLTVVDKGVVRHDVTEFFMQAHKVIKGTGKMPAYSVLINEPGFTIEQVQSMMMALCFTHQIVLQAISIPEPVFQADEWAKRGRNNFFSMVERMGGWNSVPMIEDGSGNRKVDWPKVTSRLCYQQSSLMAQTRANA